MQSKSEIILEVLKSTKPALRKKCKQIYEVLKNPPAKDGRLPYPVLLRELESFHYFGARKAADAVHEAEDVGFIKRQEVILPEARLREKREWDGMHEDGTFSGKLYRPEFETDYVVLWEYDEPPDAVKQEELGEIPQKYRSRVKTVMVG